MENKCILSNKILLLICLFESWIKQFHKEKRIKYVALMDIIFSVSVSLILSMITYLFIIYFMYMSVKGNVKNTYTFFYFSSFRNIAMVYFIILIIVCFQNLFDENFNIASKFKLLILALFQGITINGLILTIVKVIFLYFAGWMALTYAIGTVFDPYIGTFFTSDIEIKNIFNAVLIFSLIIIFLIQVYGVNNSFKSSRRKVVIYSISTIIAVITTLNSISKITKGQEFSYVFSIEFVSLTLALILSVDRVASSLKTMAKEYNNFYNDTLCKPCIIEDLSFMVVKNKIKYFLVEKLDTLKSYYHDIKKLSLFRKSLLFLYLIVVVPILFKYITPESIAKVQTVIDSFFTRGLYYISSLIEEKTKFKVDYIYNFVILLLKIFVTFIIIVTGIFCTGKTVSISKSISDQIKNRKINRISYENLYKELITLGISSYIAVMICMLPFVLHDSPILKFIGLVFKFLIIIIFNAFILAFICWAWTKVNVKIGQYKQSKKIDS